MRLSLFDSWGMKPILSRDSSAEAAAVGKAGAGMPGSSPSRLLREAAAQAAQAAARKGMPLHKHGKAHEQPVSLTLSSPDGTGSRAAGALGALGVSVAQPQPPGQQQHQAQASQQQGPQQRQQQGGPGAGSLVEEPPRLSSWGASQLTQSELHGGWNLTWEVRALPFPGEQDPSACGNARAHLLRMPEHEPPAARCTIVPRATPTPPSSPGPRRASCSSATFCPRQRWSTWCARPGVSAAGLREEGVDRGVGDRAHTGTGGAFCLALSIKMCCRPQPAHRMAQAASSGRRWWQTKSACTTRAPAMDHGSMGRSGMTWCARHSSRP